MTFTEYASCFGCQRASGEGQPKRIKEGRARRESSALIGWHGNTDFFVSPRRERRQRILGITGTMTGGKHAQTDTETGARLSHIKIQGRSNNLPSPNERGIYSFSLVFPVLLQTFVQILCIAFYLFSDFLPLLFSS